MHRLLAPLVGLLCCCVLQLTLQQNQERVFAAVKDLTETVANVSLPAEDGVVVDQTWADNKVRSLVTCPVVTVLADEFPDCHAAILQAGYCDGSSFCGTSARLVAFISPCLVAFIQWEFSRGCCVCCCSCVCDGTRNQSWIQLYACVVVVVVSVGHVAEV